MADVIELSPRRAADGPNVTKLRAASRGLELLFGALFWLIVGVGVFSLWVVLFYPGEMIAVGPRGGILTTGPLPPDFIPFHRWRLDQKLAYVPVVILRTAPAVVLFEALRRLFQRYAAAEVFSARNARLIQIAAICLCADAAAPFLCHLVLSATGYEIDKAWAHMKSLEELVLGAVVFVIAQVMEAGREIEEDREGFV